ncbi:MAG: hypothetical protein ACTJHC_08560 [Vagococcus sp.]
MFRFFNKKCDEKIVRQQRLYAMSSGELISLSEVRDNVFSRKSDVGQ